MPIFGAFEPGLTFYPSSHASAGADSVDIKRHAFKVLAALTVLSYAPCNANVPAPPTPPPVPAGYCSAIYDELNTDLQAFNAVMATPPTWTPVSGGPTVYGANLQWADSNTGPVLSNPTYLTTNVLPQLQALKALGIEAVSVPVLFPVLYEPFYGSQAAMQPYLDFYTQVAQAVKAAGLQLIVDNEFLFSNDIAAGWTNTAAYYSSLTWDEYMAGRAAMAATIARTMQPDYLIVANEPDTEFQQTGQQNLNNPADAAQMISQEISAVRELNLSKVPKLGAGFGTWMPASGTNSLQAYTNAYLALPLDYIDIHVITINSVSQSNFLTNALTVASMAAAAGKPVAIGQAWANKETASEVGVLNLDVIRARQPFSFWAPLDAYFLKTLHSLANYTQMLYLAPEQPIYFSAYQTYGGNAVNGGAANCTCTTATCSDSDIMQTENALSAAANLQSQYTTVAFGYYDQLVTTPDTTPPSVPENLAVTPGYTSTTLSWNVSSDNVGVAGYNVYRCTPPAAGQPCAGIYIANSIMPTYADTTLTGNTLYNYQVQAFDLANNLSPLSQTVSLLTYRTSANPVPGVVATAVSPKEIDLSWSPPSDTTGLTKYLVYRGTSVSNLQEIGGTAAAITTYKNLTVSPGTTYYYGIVAVEQGIDSAMSPTASATSLPLPNPPTSVAGIPSPTKVVLSWQENPEPGGLPVSSYLVYLGTTAASLSKVGSTTVPTFTAKSLNANTPYYFAIVAVDTSNDDSVPSDQISVVTLPMPAAPVGVTATAVSATRVTIAWSENIPLNGLAIQNYSIFRGTSPASLTKLTARPTSPFTDTGASPDTTYYYAIEAADTGGNISPMSATAQATTPSSPAAPVSVAATANSASRVTVTWSENIQQSGLPIQSYNISRGTSPTSLTKLATRSTPSFADTAVSPATTYYYAVQAVDTGGDASPLSATVQAGTPPMPAAPSGVVAVANSAARIIVTWSENIPLNGLPIQIYSIFRGTSATSLSKLASRTTPSISDTGVSPNTTYYYAIQATDIGADVSPMSATVQITTYAMPAAPVSVLATANSSTAVTLTWSETTPSNGLPIQYFSIFRGTSPGSLVKLTNRSGAQFYDTGLSPATTYYYAVEAVDTAPDTSPMSATSQVTTPN